MVDIDASRICHYPSLLSFRYNWDIADMWNIRTRCTFCTEWFEVSLFNANLKANSNLREPPAANSKSRSFYPQFCPQIINNFLNRYL